jgi:CRISPR-associated endonuclease/helicase Cas3
MPPALVTTVIGKQRRGQDGTTSTHPLLCHLIDVWAVARELWGCSLGRSLRRYASACLGLDEEPAGRWVAFWAGLHDIGKASPAFQARCSGTGARPSPSHGLITAEVVGSLLKARGWPAPWAVGVSAALGAHHGILPTAADLESLTRDDLGRGSWAELRKALIDEFCRLSFPGGLTPPRRDPTAAFLTLLAGLVSVADWIGSNEEFFPYAGQAVDLDSYARAAQGKARQALLCLGWTGWQPPAAPADMATLFEAVRLHGPRPLQAAIVDLADVLDGPGLVLIEAPMGEGKTEAAMYLADHWAATRGQRGCYFALPTEATSNQMFGRVRDFLAGRYPEAQVNLQLLHGHASLSAEFEVLRERGARLFAPSNIEAEGGHGRDSAPGDVLAAEWFTYRKRGLLAPFGVGTVDQALLAVLKTRHFFVRLFGLAGKTIILDEVHAYDAYMTTLLERLLEWLAALGCSVVVLSATLPRRRHRALRDAYARGLGLEPEQVPPASSYPRISWATRSSLGDSHVEASPQTAKTVRLGWLPAAVAELGPRLAAALAGGGCAAVICSTVGRAQELYRSLKAYFPVVDAGDGQPELDLFHARYPFEQRAEREQRALTRFGKPDDPRVERPHRAVLVATQVIEQSLDLDFDLIVTELAPVDLVLQRAGRLQRHQRPRPPGLEVPTLWVVSPEMDGPLPRFGASEGVYAPHLLLRSWLALKERTALRVPEDVETLVEAVYQDGQPPEGLDEVVRELWLRTWEELQRKMALYEAEAAARYVLPPYDDAILEDRPAGLEEDEPDVHPSLQALTRLSPPSVPLVLLYGSEEAAALDPTGAEPVDLRTAPDNATACRLLGRSLRLSHRQVAPWLLANALRPPKWNRSPLLRHHCVVFLDEGGLAEAGSRRLRLDPEEGLIIL